MKLVFISSTFRDMQAERDILHQRVFPRIRRRLEEYGENIQELDLRWGVDTSNMSEEKSGRAVIESCIDSIDRCKPYMIVLLGNRYGWIPDPKILSDLNDERVMERLYEGSSITQMEILYGAPEDSRPLDKCIFCIRDPYLPEKIPAESRGVYEAESPLHRQKQESLKSRILAREDANVIYYNACWSEEEHGVAGLEEFEEQITKQLWDMMSREMVRKESGKPEATEENYDIDEDGYYISKDGIFSIDEFMTDLGNLYQAARFYTALEGVCFDDENAAYNLYKDGRHFDGLPFFERYKHPQDEPDIDYSSAGGDLLKEMQLDSAYRETYPMPEVDGEFDHTPYDDYEKLRDTLIDMIPDFRIRLKVDPKTEKLVFSADVNSIFDIAWYTLARMLSEDSALLDKGKEKERPEGIMICCRHCDDFIMRRNSRQEYCDKQECQRARNAKNQRDYRERGRIAKLKMENKTGGRG